MYSLKVFNFMIDKIYKNGSSLKCGRYYVHHYILNISCIFGYLIVNSK